jgi:hypothetical protein
MRAIIRILHASLGHILKDAIQKGEWRFGGVLTVGGRFCVLIQKAGSVIIGQGEILPEALHDALRQTPRALPMSERATPHRVRRKLWVSASPHGQRAHHLRFAEVSLYLDNLKISSCQTARPDLYEANNPI